MTPRRRCAAGSDGGAVLVLVLVFVSVVSIVLGGLTTELSAHFGVTRVVAERLRQAYAADAAVELTVEALRDGEGCLTPASGRRPLGDGPLALQSDLVSVDRSCEVRSGFADPSAQPRGFGLVVTGDGPVSVTGGPKAVEGSVLAPGTTGGEVRVLDGEAGAFAPCRGAPPGFVTASPWAPPACTTLRAGDVVPALAPEPVGSNVNPPGVPYGTCTVYFPGSYDSAGITQTITGRTYFASGVYHLHDVRLVVGDGAGGADVALAGRRVTDHECGLAPPPPEPQPPPAVDGEGARFVLFGDSSITVAGDGALTIDTAFDRISVHGAAADDPWRGSIEATGALTVHGFVLAPGRPVAVRVTEAAGPALRGGAVVGALSVSGPGTLAVTTPRVAAGVRRIVVTAVAWALDGAGGPRRDDAVTAVAHVDVDPQGAVVVRGSRTERSDGE